MLKLLANFREPCVQYQSSLVTHPVVQIVQCTGVYGVSKGMKWYQVLSVLCCTFENICTAMTPLAIIAEGGRARLPNAFVQDTISDRTGTLRPRLLMVAVYSNSK